MTDAIALDAVGLTIQGRTILHDISLTIRGGSLAALLGPSGCGKSTLLNLLAGFERPTTGTVHVDGELVTSPDPRRVLLFQDGALLPWRTAEQNVAFGLEARGLDQRAARERARSYLAQVGLGTFADRLPGQLSGGQRQRVALARALAAEPRVIFMDEPFSALDTITRERLQDLVLKLAAQHDTTVVLVTHDIDEALYLADQCFVLAPDPGRLVDVVEVDAAQPRQRGSQVLSELKQRIVRHLIATWNEQSF
ncbi:MAG TPA: ABC transporter ATP-binding protein, partial [Polyangiaceae bacterium]|nr:ABC transporter ATP-binding protein [Polyangiaceae bacterium]